MEEQKGENKSQLHKKGIGRKAIFGIIVVLVLSGASVAALATWGAKEKDNLKFIVDARAKDGTIKDGVDQKKLEKALQEETDKRKFSFGINSKPEFEDGKSAGALCIENPSVNNYAMIVQIQDNNTKQIIYASGEIEPGYGIEKAKLNVQLEKGSYPCTAILRAVDEGKKTGEIQVPVTIKINQ